MKKITPAYILITLILPALLHAEAFDTIGIGPRAAAMSGAFTSAADDINSIQYNPAGLGAIKRSSWSLAYNNLYSLDIFNYYFLGYVSPRVGPGTLGLSWTFLYLGKHSSLRNFYENSFFASYGAPVTDRLKIGVSAKIFFADYNGKLGAGFTADAGFIYSFNAGFSAGLTGKNLTAPGIYWDSGWSDRMMPDLDAGASWRFRDMLLVSAGFKNAISQGRSFCAGAEMLFFKGVLATRAGIDAGRVFSFSVGIGIAVYDCIFDCSFRSHSDLGWDNSFSVTIRI